MLYQCQSLSLRARIALSWKWLRNKDVAYLDESDVCGSLAEALTADEESVLADETSWMGADAAVKVRVSLLSQITFSNPSMPIKVSIMVTITVLGPGKVYWV